MIAINISDWIKANKQEIQESGMTPPNDSFFRLSWGVIRKMGMYSWIIPAKHREGFESEEIDELEFQRRMKLYEIEKGAARVRPGVPPWLDAAMGYLNEIRDGVPLPSLNKLAKCCKTTRQSLSRNKKFTDEYNKLKEAEQNARKARRVPTDTIDHNELPTSKRPDRWTKTDRR